MMKSAKKSAICSFQIALCGLALVFTLAACSLGGGTAAGSTPTLKPTPTPSPTPTQVPLQTYTGTGFTIGYPTGWTPANQNEAGVTAVSIQDSQQVNAVAVFVVSLAGANETADQVATGETTSLIPLLMKNPQPVTTVAPTTTLAGETWVQKAFTGTPSNGPTQTARLYMLVTVHNSKAYVIVYGGPDATFTTENKQDFQPILQSFKFTG